MAAAEVQAELDQDTIFAAVADAMSTSAAVQMEQLMTETGMHWLACLTIKVAEPQAVMLARHELNVNA